MKTALLITVAASITLITLMLADYALDTKPLRFALFIGVILALLTMAAPREP